MLYGILWYIMRAFPSQQHLKSSPIYPRVWDWSLHAPIRAGPSENRALTTLNAFLQNVMVIIEFEYFFRSSEAIIQYD